MWHPRKHTRIEKNKNKNEVNWAEGINSLAVKICCTWFSKSDPLNQMYFLLLPTLAFLLGSYFFKKHDTGHVGTTTIPLHRLFLPPWIISRKLRVHLSAVERIWALESEQMGSDWERQLRKSKNMVPQAVVRKPGCSHTAGQPRAPFLALCTPLPSQRAQHFLCDFYVPSVTSMFLHQGCPQGCINCPLLQTKSPPNVPHSLPKCKGHPACPFLFAPATLPTAWPRAQRPAHSGNSRNTGLVNECGPHDSFSRKFNAKITYSTLNP